MIFLNVLVTIWSLFERWIRNTDKKYFHGIANLALAVANEEVNSNPLVGKVISVND